MSKVGGALSSSWMISLQRSMHSSQMYTPGPAISFLTCRCDFPQKEHSSCSLVSVGRAISSQLSQISPVDQGGLRPVLDDLVDDPVVLGLGRAHEVVALGVARDLLER